MIIIILNKSKNNSFKKSKRIINKVLNPIDLRINMGNLPKRVIIKLISDLKLIRTKNTNICIFIENKNCFSNFNLIEIGKKNNYLNIFKMFSEELN